MLDDKERRLDLGVLSWSEWITKYSQTM